MLFLFDFMSYLGYFSIMIIFLIIAIATAVSKSAWIWYVIGAVIQLVSLSGMQMAASFDGADTTMYWVIYVGLLIVTALLITMRYSKSNRSD